MEPNMPSHRGFLVLAVIYDKHAAPPELARGHSDWAEKILNEGRTLHWAGDLFISQMMNLHLLVPAPCLCTTTRQSFRKLRKFLLTLNPTLTLNLNLVLSFGCGCGPRCVSVVESRYCG